jgi:hypothetical protein
MKEDLGQKIEKMCGDITKLNVDAIVNAADYACWRRGSRWPQFIAA